MKSVLPKWEKVLERNFPPFAYSTSAHMESRGLSIGPMHWERGREILVNYGTPQSWVFMDPNAYYVSNMQEIVNTINPAFERELDRHNASIRDAIRVMPGMTRADLGHLNDLHKLVYILMVVAYDTINDIRAVLDTKIVSTPELEAYLATPIEKTAIERERNAMEVARIAVALNSQRRQTLCVELATEFGFIHQDYLGEAWGAVDYERALTDALPLASHMSEGCDLTGYSEYERWLITIFRKMLYLYEEGRNAMVRCMWAMKETCKMLEIHDVRRVLFMTIGEVEAFAAGTGEIISDELYEKRKQAYAAYFENKVLIEVEGMDAVGKLIREQGIESYWNEMVESVGELRGSLAFKGYAKGRARIVLNQADANAVEEGDILISPMTQVEFLSGLRKCAAIVTDEGGIVCHAAIVAREFGKPCILATKHATRVIQTGDLVEVDAHTGTVRILERKK